MSAKPERDTLPFIDPGGDDADQLRSLVSAMLSGTSRDESYLREVTSLCQTKPESGRRLLALIERYQRLGQIPIAQYTRIRRKIEGSLPPDDKAGPRSADARVRKQQAKQRRRESVARAERRSERASTVTAAVPVRAAAAPLPLPTESTTTAPLPAATATASKTAPPSQASPTGQAHRVPPRRTPPDPPQAAAAAAPSPGASPPSPPPVGTTQAPSRGDLVIEPGAVLRERYELESLIGSGGMAAVYRAVDRYRARLGLPDCHVALKIVAPRSAAPADDAALGREFHNAQQLSHPNIVNVFEIDHEAGATFYTMELLEGQQLDVLQARLGGPLPRAQALAIVRDIGAAIEHAHSRGILHADLKPQNVFITYGGQVRILDFGGLGIQVREPHGPWISEPAYDDAGTAERYRTATPAYASCEQLEGQQVDARDDIYALACICYELLTGRHPFDGCTALQARAQHLHPRRPSQLPAASWRALRRALSWQRAQRPRDIGPWLEQLGVAEAAVRLPPSYELRALPPKNHWKSWAALAAAVLLCVGAAATLALREAAPFNGPQWLSSARTSLQQARTSMQQAGSRMQDRLALWHAAIPAPGAAQPPSPGAATVPAPPAAPAVPVAVAAPPVPLPPAARHRPGTDTPADAPAAIAAGPGTAPAPESALASQPVEFSSASYEVHDSAPAARVIVRRSGDTQDDLQFVWWTQDDTAKADVDYAPLGRRTEHLLPGQDHMTLYVPIISNPLRHATTTFFVALGQPGEAATSPSARASVTIERGG